MAQESDGQPISRDHSAPANGLNDSNGLKLLSNYNGESTRMGLGNEIQELPSSGNKDVQGIEGPSFRDNEFQTPTKEPPRLELPASEDGFSTKARAARCPGFGLGINTALQVPPPGSASESGRSDLSFASIVTVNDRGAEAHMAWEESILSGHAHQKFPGHPSASTVRGNSRSLTKSVMKESEQSDFQGSSGQRDEANSSTVGNGIDVESIGNEICDSFEQSAFNDSYYLSLDRLREILAPHVVWQLLRQEFDASTAARFEVEVLGNRSSDPKANLSRPRRRRIFAILILVGTVKRLKEFIDSGIDDTNLPFIFEPKKGPRSQTELCYCTHDRFRPYRFFARWPSKTAQDFSHYQQAIHVPFFKFPGDEISFYDLHHESTLPFRYYEAHESGGYGSVRKAGIHHAHHDYNGNTEQKEPQDFAVKRLHVPNADDYLKEVHVFDKLGIEKGDSLSNHLIPLQLTFKHGRDFFLMFPWADGNLKQFWERRKADPRDQATIRWFFNQSWGIARGLRKIHHLSTEPKEAFDVSNASKMVLSPAPGDREWGRHGDIKPENILWFKDYDGRQDHLVISDFGLTQFNSANSRSKVLQDQIQGFSGTYRPPDLHLDDQISQRYDVWSLGCVLLEFISWFLLGYQKGIDDFAAERTKDKAENPNSSEDKFFYLYEGTGDFKGRNGAKVKDSVIMWIRKLHNTEHCAEPLRGILDLIEYKMLVPNSQHRWDCDRVRNKLRDLQRHCINDRHYFVKKIREELKASLDPGRQTQPQSGSTNGPGIKADNEECSQEETKTWLYDTLETATKKILEHPSETPVLENEQSSICPVSDAKLADNHLHQVSNGDAGAKIPTLLPESTTNTFPETSQDEISTLTHQIACCTTQASSQGHVDSFGAQFDGVYKTKDECDDHSDSLIHLTGANTTAEPNNRNAGIHSQLPGVNLQQEVSQDDELSSHASRPNPEPLLRLSTGPSTKTGSKTLNQQRLRQKFLTWAKKKILRRIK
ncbi:Fc.00g001400.m01.CDS01 [Cosmosporella sp. VM-42]